MTCRLSFIAVLVAAVATVSLVSCTPRQPYRVPGERILTSVAEIRDDKAHEQEVEKHSIEDHSEFSLGFVEFNDQGDFAAPEQLDRVEALIEEEAGGADGPGAIVVVFVHGWKHNARVCDENVACLRDVLTGLDNLERVYAAENDFEPRRIVGVYIGWRGLSVTKGIFKQLTFYTRKTTAHRVGRRGVADAFRRLEKVHEGLNSTGGHSRLIIIGHSFGGAVTYEAVSEIFKERLAQNSDVAGSGERIVEGFGDLVVLVNPAFEAAKFSTIHDQSFGLEEYSPQQPATLLVVTSESDTATAKMFPRGRMLTTLFSRAPDKALGKAPLRQAVGHYEPYRTHFMQKAQTRAPMLPDLVEQTEEQARGVSDCICRYIKIDSLTEAEIELSASVKRGSSTSVDLEIVHPENPQRNPFMVIGTTDEVVTEHNGIYNRVFIDFLRSFVLQEEQRRAEFAEVAEE